MTNENQIQSIRKGRTFDPQLTISRVNCNITSIEEVSSEDELEDFIEQMNLHGNRIETMDGLGIFTGLIELCLASNCLQDIYFNELSPLVKLRVLDLSANRLTCTRGFPRLPQLEELSLSHNWINSIDHLVRPVKFPRLRYLDLRGNDISNIEDLVPLKQFKRLSHLRLQASDLSMANPVCELQTYSKDVTGLLDRLQTLDEIPVDLLPSTEMLELPKLESILLQRITRQNSNSHLKPPKPVIEKEEEEVEEEEVVVVEEDDDEAIPPTNKIETNNSVPVNSRLDQESDDDDDDQVAPPLLRVVSADSEKRDNLHLPTHIEQQADYSEGIAESPPPTKNLTNIHDQTHSQTPSQNPNQPQIQSHNQPQSQNQNQNQPQSHSQNQSQSQGHIQIQNQLHNQNQIHNQNQMHNQNLMQSQMQSQMQVQNPKEDTQMMNAYTEIDGNFADKNLTDREMRILQKENDIYTRENALLVRQNEIMLQNQSLQSSNDILQLKLDELRSELSTATEKLKQYGENERVYNEKMQKGEQRVQRLENELLNSQQTCEKLISDHNDKNQFLNDKIQHLETQCQAFKAQVTEAHELISAQKQLLSQVDVREQNLQVFLENANKDKNIATKELIKEFQDEIFERQKKTIDDDQILGLKNNLDKILNRLEKKDEEISSLRTHLLESADELRKLRAAYDKTQEQTQNIDLNQRRSYAQQLEAAVSQVELEFAKEHKLLTEKYKRLNRKHQDAMKVFARLKAAYEESLHREALNKKKLRSVETILPHGKSQSYNQGSSMQIDYEVKLRKALNQAEEMKNELEAVHKDQIAAVNFEGEVKELRELQRQQTEELESLRSKGQRLLDEKNELEATIKINNAMITEQQRQIDSMRKDAKNADKDYSQVIIELQDHVHDLERALDDNAHQAEEYEVKNKKLAKALQEKDKKIKDMEVHIKGLTEEIQEKHEAIEYIEREMLKMQQAVAEQRENAENSIKESNVSHEKRVLEMKKAEASNLDNQKRIYENQIADMSTKITRLRSEMKQLSTENTKLRLVAETERKKLIQNDQDMRVLLAQIDRERRVKKQSLKHIKSLFEQLQHTGT